MTRIFLYPQLGTTSKRAMIRVRKAFGHPYVYRPRGTLLSRLAAANGMTIEAVYQQLLAERREILRTSGVDEAV